MHQRLASAEGYNTRSERSQTIYPARQRFERHGLGRVIIFVAVGAGEVASSSDNQMDKNRMARGEQPPSDHSEFASQPIEPFPLASEVDSPE